MNCFKYMSKLISILLLGGCFITCKKTNIYEFESISFRYFARKANYMWADNLRCEILTIGPVTGPKYSALKSAPNVKFSEYMLGFSTCNVDVPDIPDSRYQEFFNSDRYDPLWNAPHMAFHPSENPMTDESDPVIETRLKQHLEKGKTRSVSSLPAAQVVGIDYRITPLTGLKITCSHDLFGKKAGEELNEYFKITGYPDYHDFIITANKNLVSGQTRDISITQYLSYAPMAPAAMYFVFKKGVTLPAATTVEFTIELTIEEGKTISATTRPITLTP